MNMRHFIFFYKTTDHGMGDILVSCNRFPKRQLIEDAILKNAKEGSFVVFTGWKEFDSEEDYISFKGEQE